MSFCTEIRINSTEIITTTGYGSIVYKLPEVLYDIYAAMYCHGRRTRKVHVFVSGNHSTTTANVAHMWLNAFCANMRRIGCDCRCILHYYKPAEDIAEITRLGTEDIKVITKRDGESFSFGRENMKAEPRLLSISQNADGLTITLPGDMRDKIDKILIRRD